MNITWPIKQQTTMKMQVYLMPALSRKWGRMKGKIMQAMALIENMRLNWASSIFMYSSISSWRGD